MVSDLINFLKGKMEARERSFSERTELIPIAKSNYPLFKKTQTASFNRGGSSAAALNVSIGKYCDFCPKEMHRNEDCKLSMHDKYKALYDQYKCRRCLRKGHKKRFRNVKGIKCKTCGSQSHWEYLCDKGQKPSKNDNISGSSNESRDVCVNSLFREAMIDTGNRNIIYYQTARDVGSNKIIRGIRILIDCGSETSFLFESIAEEVGLPTVSIEKLKIHTFGSQKPHLRELKRKRVLLKDPNSGWQLECNILMIDKIVGVDLIRIPSKGIASVLRQEGLVLSYQGIVDTEKVLLIGNDLINKILTGKTCRLSENLMLYKTIFGWVINGRSRGESSSNCTLRAETVQEALSLSAGAVSILKDAGFHLRKLCTNSRELKALWIQNGLNNEVGFEQDCKLKVLGLVWNLDEDCVGVDVTPLLNSLESMGNTKRSVLSTVARVFDPLGFISPFVVRVKKLVQEIWERGVDWDSKFPDDFRIKWEKWFCETGCLSDLRINRCYFSNGDRDADGIEMHIFCDTSQVSHGAVAYFRWETTSGVVGVRFVMAKSRLAPLKNSVNLD
ncbi:hypothetical protein AVEN_221974-1 [Araneus ventricosus]|uniref:Uncharacterized protein n=1 Tax=Araneus ventricosus TaxID=182803 RepID=A0A4Y2F574_ARAVE|nr:hypothetical protein AVEN_221974-1 [Araneus ventricosus]